MTKVSPKKWYIPFAIIVVLLLGGVTVYAFNNDTSTSVNSSSPVASPAHPEKPITVDGTVECLTPNSTTSTQASSCAIGLKGDDGKNYAITATDPTTTGSLPTGTHVQVTGMVKQQTTQYDISGIIQVSSVKRL
ncbi:MAG: hypothetical protein JWO41_335 [Candidatus Saccharibacteria bacterium]|nr:hypothetical protein [Candidatus Saccharibacteria bacterium]